MTKITCPKQSRNPHKRSDGMEAFADVDYDYVRISVAREFGDNADASAIDYWNGAMDELAGRLNECLAAGSPDVTVKYAINVGETWTRQKDASVVRATNCVAQLAYVSDNVGVLALHEFLADVSRLIGQSVVSSDPHVSFYVKDVAKDAFADALSFLNRQGKYRHVDATGVKTFRHGFQDISVQRVVSNAVEQNEEHNRKQSRDGQSHVVTRKQSAGKKTGSVRVSMNDRGNCIVIKAPERPLAADKKHVVAIALETTGLDPKRNEVVRLAAYGDYGRVVYDRTFGVTRPELWSERAQEVSMLSPRDIDGLATFKDCVHDDGDLVCMLANADIIIAHNALFVIGFLSQAGVPLAGKQFGDTCSCCSKYTIDHYQYRSIHTLASATKAFRIAVPRDGHTDEKARAIYELWLALVEARYSHLSSLDEMRAKWARKHSRKARKKAEAMPADA